MKNIGNMAPAKTVDEYLERLPEEQRTTLEKLRKAIKATAPKAEELMSYGIPSYKYMGALIYFGAYPNHLSLYAVSKKLLKAYAEELKPFKIQGTTVHFTPENPMPLPLIKRIVKDRIKDNEDRMALKATSKKAATGKTASKKPTVVKSKAKSSQ